MSAIVDAQADKTTSRRTRRRPAGGRRRGPRPDGEQSGEAAAPRERKERPEAVPVPADFIGKEKVGVVSAIIRKGRVKFGFINICPGPEIDEAAPRIYFNFTALADPAVTIRRGYIVSFKVNVDETQRPLAENIALTEEGKRLAAERDAEYLARQAAKPAEDAERPKRAPRERKPVAEKPVTITVTCEGKTGSQVLTINAAQSVGKLKSVATTAFEAPIEYNVYHVDSTGHVFMTKAILLSLVDGAKVHLAAPKAETA